MEDIRIYDTDFNLLKIENDVISSNWTVYFNGVGTFEIHTLTDTGLAEIIIDNMDLQNNKIPLVAQGDLQGVVTGVRLGEDFAIYGRTCNWFLSRKVVPEFKSSDLPVTCNPEEIARYIVANAFSDQKNFTLDEKVGLEDIDNFWRNTYNPLSQVVQEVLLVQNAGHRLSFNPSAKKWIFSVIPPKQSNVILSESNKNAFNTEYTYSIDGYCSACWYEQEQPFTDGEFPDPVWTRFVKDEKTGIFSSECVSWATVESEAESHIKEKTVKSEIVTDVCGLKFGEDFNLGDILRVQFVNGRIKRTEKKQISGVSLGWEEGLESRQVILNNI